MIQAISWNLHHILIQYHGIFTIYWYSWFITKRQLKWLLWVLECTFTGIVQLVCMYAPFDTYTHYRVVIRSLLMSLSVIQLCWDIFILFGRMREDNLTERVSMVKWLPSMNVRSVKTDLTTIWSTLWCILVCYSILLLTAHHPMWNFNLHRMSLTLIIQHKYSINEKFIFSFPK